MRNRLEEIEALVYTYKYVVITLVEIWFYAYETCYYQLDGYKAIHVNTDSPGVEVLHFMLFHSWKNQYSR